MKLLLAAVQLHIALGTVTESTIGDCFLKPNSKFCMPNGDMPVQKDLGGDMSKDKGYCCTADEISPVCQGSTSLLSGVQCTKLLPNLPTAGNAIFAYEKALWFTYAPDMQNYYSLAC